RHHGPGEDPRLLPRERRDDLAPAPELLLRAARAVNEIIQARRERARARRRFHGVAEGHLLEGEEQIGSRFDPYGARRDLGELFAPEQRTIRVAIEHFLP